MKPDWYRDSKAWALIGGYLSWLAVLSLAWEIAQLPLYTIWFDASPSYLIFAVTHCTGGDVLIGTASLMLALILGREGPLHKWHWWRITASMLVFGPGYTVLSEWWNTALLRWTYSELMPTLSLAGVELGVSPLLQWLVVPQLALYLTRRRMMMTA